MRFLCLVPVGSTYGNSSLQKIVIGTINCRRSEALRYCRFIATGRRASDRRKTQPENKFGRKSPGQAFGECTLFSARARNLIRAR